MPRSSLAENGDGHAPQPADGAALLTQAMHEGYIDASAFLRFGPLVVIGLLASIPLLLRMGRIIG